MLGLGTKKGENFILKLLISIVVNYKCHCWVFGGGGGWGVGGLGFNLQNDVTKQLFMKILNQ